MHRSLRKSMIFSYIYARILTCTSLALCLIGMFTVKIAPFNKKYKRRIQIVLYDFFSFLKAKLLHADKRFPNDTSLIKNYLSYITKYLLAREFNKKHPVTSLKTDRLLHYSIFFSTYESMFGMFNEIFGHGVYKFVADNKTPLILDCGSNIGISILYFKSLYPNARIIGFEPCPETFEILQKNISSNNLKEVILHNKAVHDKEDTLSFYVSSQHISQGGWSIKGAPVHNYELHKQMVQAVTLSSYINEPVDLLKMDIEGAEIMVLNELAASGKLSMIKQILLEYHHHMTDPSEDCFANILKIFEDYNFGYQFNSIEKAVPEKKNRNVMILYVYNKNLTNPYDLPTTHKSQSTRA